MTVRVTCAPGCHFTISPHPSGLPGLPALVVHGGGTATVTEARAADLWRARLIRHPITGALPPPPDALQEPKITVTGPNRRDAVTVDGTPIFSLWEAADAEPPASTNANRPPRPVPGLQPVSPGVAIRTFDDAVRGGVRIDGPGARFTY